MRTEWRRGLLGLGVACVTALVFGIVFAAGLGIGASLAVAAVVGGVTAAIAAQPSTPASAPSAALPQPAPGPIDADKLSRLRHDLRGVLSPALLTADRLLASSDDPAVRRAAETMIETIDRATRILAGQAPGSQPPAP